MPADDRPFTVTARFNLTLSQQSKLLNFIEAWRGDPFDELDFHDDAIDIESWCLERRATLTIVHRSTPKGDRAQIVAIEPPTQDNEMRIEDYVRFRDRSKQSSPAPSRLPF
jgi:hypothetical protein